MNRPQPGQPCNARQRKSANVFSNLGDLGFADFKIGIQTFDNRLALQKIVALTHHGDADKAQLSSAELVAGKFAEGRDQEFISKRTNILFHQFVEGAGWIGHLPSHQTPFPCRPLRIEQVLEKMVNQAAETFLRRIGRLSHRITPGGSSGARIQDDQRIKFRLIPEMIVHGGDIDPGPIGDGADGGALEPLLGKHFAGGAENFIAGLFFAEFRRGTFFFSDDHAGIFKRMFETVK
jgi:hypothetical protein